MKLEGAEFMRRFLMHVLPHGCMRIRHFGFLANCVCLVRVNLVRQLLKVTGILPKISQVIKLPKPGRQFCLCSPCH